MNNLTELFNPRLCDFTEDQLGLILRSILTEQHAISQHVESLESYSSLTYMMREKIEDYRKEMEALGEIVVQFAGAMARKEKERLLESN